MRSKVLKILIAVFAVCMIAPAFSAVENVKVGGDVFVYGVLRGDWEGDGTNLHCFFSQVRVWVSADLSENVSTMIRLINERPWGVEWEEDWVTRNEIMLDLAYIKVKDMLTPGLSLTVGRQEIQFGEGLVVGNRYWAGGYYPSYLRTLELGLSDLGLQKAFDAIRIDYAPSAVPMNITAFYSKIGEQFYSPTDYESNLWGLDLGFKLAEVCDIDLYYVGLGAIPEFWNPYWNGFWSVDTDTGILHTAGVRIVSGIPNITGLTLKAEYAKQFGNSGTNHDIDFRGWALLAGIKYEIPAAMKPVIKFNYARYSGDNPNTDEIMENWLPVFPGNIGSSIGPLLYAYDAFQTGGAIVGGGDAQVFNLGFGFSPAEKWSVCLDGYWVTPVVGAWAPLDATDYGIDTELTIEYKHTEDLTFGMQAGTIWGGDLFGGSLGRPWQILGYMKVSF